MWRYYKKKFDYFLNHTLISANKIPFVSLPVKKREEIKCQHGKGGGAVFGQ